MTDTTERAELLAIEDRHMAQINYSVELQRIIEDLCHNRPIREPKSGAKHHYEMAVAYRLAAQDQKPVAHQLRVKDGSYCRIIPDGELEEWKINWANHLARGHAEIIPLGPLYLSPPPAPGWYEAIEAATRICHEAAAETDGNASRGAMAEELASSIEALRSNPPSGAGVADDPAEYLASTALTNQPLAADSNASTEIGSLREKLSDALAGGLPHKSDCAVYLAPAYEPRPCDCGASNASAEARLREHKWFDPECHEKGCQSLVWRGFYETVVKGRADFREAFRKQRDQAKRLREALRNIAEGNLGGLPGQANYARIREVAREALSAHPNASDVTEEELERWLFNKGLTLSSRSISRALLDAHTVRRR